MKASMVIAGLIALPLWAASFPALAGDESSAPAPEAAEPKGFWERDTLTGNWGGLRDDLADNGLKFTATYTGETLGNVSGGLRRRAVAEGLLQLDIDADLEKAMGWKGGLMHLTAFHIHGRQLSANFLGANLATVRDIEANPATRLYSVWFQQSVLDDMVSLRFGQLPMQEEFYTSANSAYLLNGAFGWPLGFSANLPSSGSGYPVANLGSRLKVQATEQLAILAGVFTGDVAPGSAQVPDPQKRNRSGVDMRVDQPPLWLAEVDYGVNQEKDAEGLPAMFKLGGLYYNGRALDQRYDNTGLPLAASDSSTVAKPKHGNWAVYGVIDQMLWKTPGTADGGLSTFFRTTVLPEDRNQLPFAFDTGLTYKGLFEGRDDDVAAIGFAYGRISPALAARDSDARRMNTSTAQVRDFEAAVELTYRYQVTPWWTIVPDAQYIFHPAGGAGLPDRPATPIPDAAVLGLRTVFKL
ncbi:carbohydrate porin [Paramagnetospirillum kuznetsovii]|nr:carbohydrate porin [Paramagnetospirillum kuznetsovii]